jgi:hypothetical protein
MAGKDLVEMGMVLQERRRDWVDFALNFSTCPIIYASEVVEREEVYSNHH